MNIVLVALGGAFGSVMRYLMQNSVGRFSPNFPLGTMLINIIGSFLMGLLVGWLAKNTPENAQNIRLLLAVGVLGGFTTFSSFSLDAIVLYEQGRLGAMCIYILASVAVSLIGLFAGLQLMRTL